MQKSISTENIGEQTIDVYSVYGRPDKNWTREAWDKAFEKMKLEVKSGRATICNTSKKYSNSRYIDTNVGQYGAFLKSIEQEIKRGQADYLYFGYQVWDMLFRFKKCLNKLKITYLPEDECFMILFGR